MRIVVDTNVLVSAVLRDRDPELVIQFLVDQSEFEWIASAEIIIEYKEVLGRKKFRLTEEIKERWFCLLDQFVTIVEVNFSVDFSTDPGDAKFLACAIAGKADFLITGDRGLSSGRDLVDSVMLTVAEFKELFC